VGTRAESPPMIEVKDDRAFIADENTYVAFVMAPDETKIEFAENKSLTRQIAVHHVHFATPDVAAMKAWYVKVFGAKPGWRGSFEAADLAGGNLTFSGSKEPVAPTRRHALDHIGFEIEDLKGVCRQLEGKGITLDSGYNYSDAVKLGVAFVTDPWGTRIELTEGLGKY